MPPMRGIIPYAESAALPVGVYVPDRYEVAVHVEGAPIRESQRLVGNNVVNGPPDIDDTHASLQQSVGIVGELVSYTHTRSFE